MIVEPEEKMALVWSVSSALMAQVDGGGQPEALPFGGASAGPWFVALARGGCVQIIWIRLVVAGDRSHSRRRL